MAEVDVRRARQSDAAAVAALNDFVHDLHVEAEPYDFRRTDTSEVRTFFEFIIKGPSHVVLLATADDSPVDLERPTLFFGLVDGMTPSDRLRPLALAARMTAARASLAADEGHGPPAFGEARL